MLGRKIGPAGTNHPSFLLWLVQYFHFYWTNSEAQWGAIAPWFRLRLPLCGPRFKSQVHLSQFNLKLCLILEWLKDENKEARIRPYKQSTTFLDVCDVTSLRTNIKKLIDRSSAKDFFDDCQVLKFEFFWERWWNFSD